MLKKLRLLIVRRKPAAGSARGRSDVRRKWLRRVAVGIAIFLVVFSLTGVFIVPPLARHYLAKGLGDALGRAVAIDAVTLNPFSMVATVKGLTVREPDGSAVFVSFSELRADLQAESLFRLGPILREVVLTDPYVHVVRNEDGRTYNFSDLIDKFSRPAPAKEEESAEPARFSLNNVQIRNGRIEIDDRPKLKLHTVRNLNVAIPFLSSLPYRANEYVQPSLAALLNDAPLSLQGRTKPFQDTLETSLDINLDALNLPSYMEYLPVDPGFRLDSGNLDVRLTLTFVRAAHRPPILWVKGILELHDLAMTERDGKPLLKFSRLEVPVTAINVTDSKFTLGAVALEQPEAFVRRNADGSLNWMAVVPKDSAPKDRAPDAGERAAPEALALTVPEVAIRKGKLHFVDLVPKDGFRTDLTNIEAALRNFALPQAEPAQAELSFGTGFGEAVRYTGSLALSPTALEGSVEVRKVKLASYLPYYRNVLHYSLEDGMADISTRYAFTTAGGKPDAKLTRLELALSSVRLRKPGAQEDFLSVKDARVRNASLDLGKQTMTVGEFTTRGGFLDVVREPDGTLNATRILATPAQTGPEGPAAESAGPPWRFSLDRADLQQWQVSFTDLTGPEPVKVLAGDISLQASGISNQQDHQGRFGFSARLNDTGRIEVQGPLSINPLATDLKVDLQDFGLVPLQPYFSDRINILLTSADLSLAGNARLAVPADGAPAIAFDGDVRFTNFASVDKAGSEDFLKWATLHVGGIAYNHEPLRLDIEQVALSDFYSRIIIFPDGRLNLQDVAANPNAPAQEAAAAADSTDGEPAAQAAVQDAAAKPLPPIRIGNVTLQNGDVNFTDLFIKPNYSANLSEIGGSVTGLSSQLDTTADVDLRGRFAKTAPLEIKGKVNPLVRNLFLDIKAGVHDIELGPFTPYSGRFVGYAIEKGKMNFDVAYRIEDRKLSASNRIVLDQLTFGGKVESPQATKLPVLLAVALLKDRNGVIDVDLPISGSLDDPKFSVGGVIVRVIINLVTKAITAPFALIGKLAGGSGEELSYVEFDAGQAALTAEAQKKLDALIKGLADRPGLKLDVTPRADPGTDREGLRRRNFDQLVKAQKLKDLVKQGAPVNSVDDVTIAQEEYEKYLRRAYKDAEFPKPRNAIGFVKDLPLDETEKLMLAHIQISDDDLAKLANQRGQAVKDFLTRNGGVEPGRVFLIAPRMEAAKPDDKLKPGRVDFSLK